MSLVSIIIVTSKNGKQAHCALLDERSLKQRLGTSEFFKKKIGCNFGVSNDQHLWYYTGCEVSCPAIFRPVVFCLVTLQAGSEGCLHAWEVQLHWQTPRYSWVISVE